MKRRILYRMGRFLWLLGEAIAKRMDKISWFGFELWYMNCDCEMCMERRKEADEVKEVSET